MYIEKLDKIDHIGIFQELFNCLNKNISPNKCKFLELINLEQTDEFEVKTFIKYKYNNEEKYAPMFLTDTDCTDFITFAKVINIKMENNVSALKELKETYLKAMIERCKASNLTTLYGSYTEFIVGFYNEKFARESTGKTKAEKKELSNQLEHILEFISQIDKGIIV